MAGEYDYAGYNTGLHDEPMLMLSKLNKKGESTLTFSFGTKIAVDATTSIPSSAKIFGGKMSLIEAIADYNERIGASPETMGKTLQFGVKWDGDECIVSCSLADKQGNKYNVKMTVGLVNGYYVMTKLDITNKQGESMLKTYIGDNGKKYLSTIPWNSSQAQLELQQNKPVKYV